MKLRNYAAGVTGLASSILTANMMYVFTSKDALEIVICTSVVAGMSTLLVLLDSEPQQKHNVKKRTVKQYTVQHEDPLNGELIEGAEFKTYKLDPETWGK